MFCVYFYFHLFSLHTKLQFLGILYTETQVLPALWCFHPKPPGRFALPCCLQGTTGASDPQFLSWQGKTDKKNSLGWESRKGQNKAASTVVESGWYQPPSLSSPPFPVRNQSTVLGRGLWRRALRMQVSCVSAPRSTCCNTMETHNKTKPHGWREGGRRAVESGIDP